MFEWGIKSLKFSSGDEISVERASTLIILGPNSSGKSTALKNILYSITNSNPLQVIVGLDFFLSGDKDNLLTWLKTNYPIHDNRFLTADGMIFKGEYETLWTTLLNNNRIAARNHTSFFIQLLDTTTRLILADVALRDDLNKPEPKRYIHLLQLDGNLKTKISAELHKAFGVDLEINFGGSNKVWFHVGNLPEKSENESKLSPIYLERLNKLPHIEQEGDGIRSFVGTLLATMCGKHPVLLIDEPEAFLHQKQAEQLANILSKSAEELNRQVIIATHSAAIVRGALEGSNRVAVCRLTREGDINHASLLDSHQLKQLWSKPLLRSVSAVAGVFYTGVVICEAESDVRFYESILRYLESDNKLERNVDLYFTSGGGKGQLATFANAYKSLKIRVATIADLDLLRREGEFKKTFEILGGDFSKIAKIYKEVSLGLNDLPPTKSSPDFISETEKILAEARAQGLTPDHLKAINNLLADAKKWSQAKRYGIKKLKGGVHKSAIKLLAACKSHGLFLVPCGELESWWNAGSVDKDQWALEALEEISSNPNTFFEAQKFVEEIYNYLKD
jgi:energy-coupling factor transporter ATP-binding protein EcfA2